MRKPALVLNAKTSGHVTLVPTHCILKKSVTFVLLYLGHCMTKSCQMKYTVHKKLVAVERGEL